jgi:hypothetical protein
MTFPGNGRPAPTAEQIDRASRLLAPFWVNGKRNDLARALAGTLVRDVGKDAAAAVIKALCLMTGDDEAAKRLAAVAQTAARLDRQERCQGAPALAKLLGPDAVRDVRLALGTIIDVNGLAEHKKLPADFLTSLGLRSSYKGVCIPYYRGDGTPAEEKTRRGLAASTSTWPTGRPLLAYGLDRLQAARQDGHLVSLTLVEGESDCWSLWHHNAGPTLGLPGSNTVQKTLTAEVIDGVGTVYVVEEPDGGGATFAASVARRLAALGYQGATKVIKLAGFKDPSAMHCDSPEQFPPRWAAAVEAAQPLPPPDPATAPGLSVDGFTLETQTLADLDPEPVLFLVPPYLSLAKVTLFAGVGGLGKSAVTLDIAACLTTGRPALGLAYQPPSACDVLLAFAEDDAADTAVPRLLAAGADLKRCHYLKGLIGPDGKRQPFSLAHCDLLRQELERRPAARLVVIDPISVYAGRTGIDTHKEAPVQAMLSALRDVASTTRVAMVVVAHLNKNTESRARDRVSGSAAFTNAARAVCLFAEDEQEQGRRVVCPDKWNIGIKPPGLVYTTRALAPAERDAVRPALAHLDDLQRGALLDQLFKVDWRGTTDQTADDVLRRHHQARPNDAQVAAEWLRTFLANGPVGSDACAAAGNLALGMSRNTKWWRDNVLKPLLGGTPRKAKFDGGWYFTLPGQPWPPPAQESEESEEYEESPPVLKYPSADSSTAAPSTDPPAEEPGEGSASTPPDSSYSSDSSDSSADSSAEGGDALTQPCRAQESEESQESQESQESEESRESEESVPGDDSEWFPA